MKTAVVILGHGSKNAGAGDSMLRVVSDLKKHETYKMVEHAFLQHASPSLSETLEYCIRSGAERVMIVPFFMQSGSHVSEDVPALVAKAKRQHPNIDIVMTDYVGAHPLMAKIVEDLVEKSSAECGMRNEKTGNEIPVTKPVSSGGLR